MFGFGKRKKPLVLHVDDSALQLMAVKNMLQLLGVDSIEAASGKDAIVLAEERKPDAIILDAMMPLMDGYQTAEILRAKASTKDIPILMLTGSDAVKDVDKAGEMGIKAYLVKPVQYDRLKSKLGALIQLPE